MERNSNSGFTKNSANLLYNQALLENMAYFTDAVWALEIETQRIQVLHDRLNPPMVGGSISLENARELILYHISSKDVEMILSSLTIDYIKNVKESEEFIVTNYDDDGNPLIYRMVMSPDFDGDGKLLRLYLSFAFTGRNTNFA